MQITVEHTISLGHRLPSYNGICASLHGHNVRVEVSVNPIGRFLDFKDVGRALQQILEPLDHALVLYGLDPVIPAVLAIMPEQRMVLLNVEPTTEALAAYVWRELGLLTLHPLQVTVHETAKYSAAVSRDRPHMIPLVTRMGE